MPIVNGYATRDDLKKQAGLDLDDIEFDDHIDKAVSAASRGIDMYTNRHFYQVSEPRLFVPDNERLVTFGTFGDLVSVSELATDEGGDGTFETVWAAADYQLHPANPSQAPEPRPYRFLTAVGTKTFPVRWTAASSSYRARITGTWGWPAVPAAIVEACLIQAHRLFKRRESPEGVAGLNMFGTVTMGRLDPDVGRLVKPYRIRTVG